MSTPAELFVSPIASSLVQPLVSPRRLQVCRRWLSSRLTLHLAHTLWVIALVPPALPIAASIFMLTAATLYLERDRPAKRLASWLTSATLILSALQLTLATSPLVLGLGAALFASSSVTLFLAHSPRLALASLPFVALISTGLALFSTPGATDTTAFAFAVPLALFAMLRPISALGHLFASLGLHHGPVDPLLLWDPLSASQSKRTLTAPETS